MVVRLCQHEAKLGASAPAADLVKDYLYNGAWEDWARRMLRGARPEALARAVTKLLNRIGERRSDSDDAFASMIAKTAAIGDVTASLIPIESTFEIVVAPHAQRSEARRVGKEGVRQWRARWVRY